MLLQRQTHTIRPMTTAHLAQTMTLLGLNALELQQKIEAELSSNPALELVEERRCPTCRRKLNGNSPCPFCSRQQGLTADQPIVYISSREDFFIRPPSNRNTADEAGETDLYSQAQATEKLSEYVMRQIAPELHPQDRALAAHILTSLDDDGLLAVPLVEIARYHFVLLSKANEVLSLIQHADPIGVASPTPEEALLVQLEVLGETRFVPPLAREAIQQGMDLLSRRHYAELGHRLGISLAQVKDIAQFISNNLNPFPARAFWGENLTNHRTDHSGPQPYYFPDMIISRLRDTPDTPLVVEIALPISGTLRVNPLFKEALRQAPPDKSEQWKADIEQASLLVKCLQQRNHTIVRLLTRLVVIQREYILYGDAYLKPVTRAWFSKDLEVHESTISRAVSNKAVQLPNKHIIPLATFFDPNLHIRTALRQIIEQESHPLSDTQIGKLLIEQGYNVARRTVAKYRAMEGILPAHLRKPVLSPSMSTIPD